MIYRYVSNIKWTPEERYHGTISTEKGFSTVFHKPSEFGGQDGVFNPQDALVASLAMCYSITVQEICQKMRLEVEDFSLEARGILEETDSGKAFTSMELYPSITVKGSEKKATRALKLAKEQCLISKSLNCDIKIK